MDNILVVGSYAVAMFIKTPRMPIFGETLIGSDFFMGPGGKGSNQAIAISRLGGKVSFICFVGNDAFNDKISDTIDYVDLARIAKMEMLTRSKLLEAVVKRIIDSAFEEIDVLSKISVTVSKLNPPINADVEAVSVTMEEER